jgi:hypothetical protein
VVVEEVKVSGKKRGLGCKDFANGYGVPSAKKVFASSSLSSSSVKTKTKKGNVDEISRRGGDSDEVDGNIWEEYYWKDDLYRFI